MDESHFAVADDSASPSLISTDSSYTDTNPFHGEAERKTRRSAREAQNLSARADQNADVPYQTPTRSGGQARSRSRLSSSSQTVLSYKEEKEAKKVVAVKPSMAPVQELGHSYPDWSVLENELEAAKTLENAYFLDSSFLRALTVMDLWLSQEGPFFMPRREFRHRHCIFNLFWQPSAPNWEKSEYVVPPKLAGLLRWYLTRDNFIKYVDTRKDTKFCHHRPDPLSPQKKKKRRPR
jgi:hypothetical protein